MKTRQDAWSHEDDVLLAETVLTHIKEGSTQLKAFDEVGDALNRTSAACGFRWNAVVRQKYLKQIDSAKRERKERKRALSASYFSQARIGNTGSASRTFYQTATEDGGSVTLESIIGQLKQLAQTEPASSRLELENKQLRAQLEEKTAKLNELETKLQRNKQEHSMIEEDYQSLISIMNRARRLAILEEDEQEHPAFRMDANGNLEKLSK
ncbi:transcriptional regulator [Shouchella clausii]|nr:transcriptional regulator [Shouchella clausii]